MLRGLGVARLQAGASGKVWARIERDVGVAHMMPPPLRRALRVFAQNSLKNPRHARQTRKINLFYFGADRNWFGSEFILNRREQR